MPLIKVIIFILFSLSLFPAFASPYENLTVALRQQKIINDLRNHCKLQADVKDEQIKNTFLNDKTSHTQIVSAVKALRNNEDEAYRQSIDAVKCPDIH